MTWRFLVALLAVAFLAARECLAMLFSPPPLRVRTTVDLCVGNGPSPPRMTTKRLAAWRSAISRNPDGGEAVREVVDAVSAAAKAGFTDYPEPSSMYNESEEGGDQDHGLAFLFVGPGHADDFADIAAAAHEALGVYRRETTTVALVGGGVVGGGAEVDDPRDPALSLLAGTLPAAASATPFCVGGDGGLTLDDQLSSAWVALESGGSAASGHEGIEGDRPLSFVLFADPWSPIDAVLKRINDGAALGGGAVIAGGISCPTSEDPTIALNGRLVPRGSVVGVRLGGSVGLQAVVAQGSRAVGPTFVVSVAQENVITELSGEPALKRLKEVVEGASDSDRNLINTGGLLCGIRTEGDSSKEGEDDFLVRQIMGLVPNVGGIVVGAAELTPGDAFRFHVRDADAAKEDLGKMVRRAEAERLFVGPERAGTPLAALQVSCVARGRSLFGAPNVDLSKVSELLAMGGSGGEEVEGEGCSAVAGFFANGEMGPVGLAGYGSEGKGTHIHGFTTVMAFLCNFTEKGTSQTDVFNDPKAWG